MLSIRSVLTTSGVEIVVVRLVECKSAISRSRLPGLDWAINPYRGCAHACRYCYAQDVTRFEIDKEWGTIVEAKINIVSRLKRELEKKAEGVYGIGTVTDPYQPAEREYELTRGCLALLKRANAKVSILTKSDLVLRDLDVLTAWADAEVGISIGCTDDEVAAITEPGACPPSRRFNALAELTRAHISSYLMAAPILPGVCDSEESLTDLVARAGDVGVRKIVWDVFNSRPMATSRLDRALTSRGLATSAPRKGDRIAALRSIIHRECSSRGIELVDAF